MGRSSVQSWRKKRKLIPHSSWPIRLREGASVKLIGWTALTVAGLLAAGIRLVSLYAIFIAPWLSFLLQSQPRLVKRRLFVNLQRRANHSTFILPLLDCAPPLKAFPVIQLR